MSGKQAEYLAAILCKYWFSLFEVPLQNKHFTY